MLTIPALVLAVTGTLAFTLPSHEAGDSCSVAQAPCTDLDSVFLDRQDPTTFRWPATIKRAGVRGMEGMPWTFTYSCDTPPCQYTVWEKDLHGNETCPSNIVQVGGTTGVPPFLPARRLLPEVWYDVAGRRVSGGPRWASGRYRSSWGRDSLLIR